MSSSPRAAGQCQDYKKVNLGASRGVAIRELPTSEGPADYVLFVDKRAVGVIEAKKAGTTLTGVEWQTRKYLGGLPDELSAFRPDGTHLPFAYESTGVETHFTCGLDPVARARQVFTFHRPDTFARWIDTHERIAGRGTFRAGIPLLPDLTEPGALRLAQFEAIGNLEESLKDDRPRALIQMATGSGKTFAATNICYRLIKYAGANRILFLVDRANLGRQTLKEFQGFETPDDGRKFTELYNLQRLASQHVDPVAKVTISTIQRLYSILRGEPEFEPELDEASGCDTEPTAPVEVGYNPELPIEAYDLILVDECHRSIYGVWRQVLDYFDAFIVGLTATPGKQTFGFFNQNMVMEYSRARAIADRVNVDFDVFRIRTEISEVGGTLDAGLVTAFRDRETRDERLEQIDEDIEYDARELDRRVVAKDQIRTIVRCFRDSLPAMFPHREQTGDGKLQHVPKTIIFAKDDSHAEDIVGIVRREFNASNEFAAKITYKSGDSGQKPEQLLQDFRTSYYPRIAVTVDMIATGTDVKPIECVVFMRMVKSRNFFEQMTGRGVRTINPDDLRVVTPDAKSKDRFVLVDAVGVTETKLVDSVPLERKHGVSLEKLLTQVQLNIVNEDVVSSLASRLARLDARITDDDRKQLAETGGLSLNGPRAPTRRGTRS